MLTAAPVLITPVPDAESEIRGRIAEAAYFLAEKRGFAPGHEMDDWLTAEAQVFDTLAAPAGDADDGA